MRPLLIIKTGCALADTLAARGDFDAWIAGVMGWDPARFAVVSVHEDEPLPDPRSVSGAIVSGSAAMVTERAAWSVRTGEWLASALETETPLLGICYGHQLLAEAAGGRVGTNPRGREIGTAEVKLLEEAALDPLFRGSPERLEVHTTHVESVLELPPGARLLAENAADPHHAFVLGSRAWGVQFHPEFDADIMRRYLLQRREVLVSEGFDPEALLAETRECPDAATLLCRFGELVERWD